MQKNYNAINLIYLQNFINLLNNPQKMAPSLYLNLEEIEYKGMVVLWVYVPVSSQIEICCGNTCGNNADKQQEKQ